MLAHRLAGQAQPLPGDVQSRNRAGGIVKPQPIHFIALLALLAVAGCAATDGKLQRRVAAEAAPLQPAVEDDQAVAEAAMQSLHNGASAARRAPAFGRRAGRLRPHRLADNPTIRRAIRQVQVLGYQVPQVTSLDDPMVNLIPPTGDMTQTAAGMMGGAVSVVAEDPVSRQAADARARRRAGGAHGSGRHWPTRASRPSRRCRRPTTATTWPSVSIARSPRERAGCCARSATWPRRATAPDRRPSRTCCAPRSSCTASPTN